MVRYVSNMVDRKKYIAREFDKLRELLGLRGIDITARTGGKLSQSEWSKIVSERSALSTDEKRALVAEGLGLPFDVVAAMADCSITAEQVMAAKSRHGGFKALVARAQKEAAARGLDGKALLFARKRPASAADNLPGAGNLHVPLPDPEREGERVAKLTELSHLKNQRFPHLELCLMYHRANGGLRWGSSTILAAQAGHFGEDDRDPASWERALDALEATATRGADHGRVVETRAAKSPS